jgi:hypothetical protein
MDSLREAIFRRAAPHPSTWFRDGVGFVILVPRNSSSRWIQGYLLCGRFRGCGALPRF